MVPRHEGIEERYGPTKVHLQVYDGRSPFSTSLSPFPFPALLRLCRSMSRPAAL